VSNRKTLPHVVYCRIWRWADLQNCNELKSVPHCQQGYNNSTKSKIDDSSVVCINPYHYIRIENNSLHNNNNVNNNLNNTNPNLLTVYVPKINNETLINTNSNINNNSNKIIHPPPPPPPPPPQVQHNGSTSSSTSSIMQTSNQHDPIHQLSVTGDLIHSSNYMITASPSPISSILSPSSIGKILEIFCLILIRYRKSYNLFICSKIRLLNKIKILYCLDIIIYMV
jgi:hypothetical protein